MGMRAVCMISNSTAIAEVFSRIDHKFELSTRSVLSFTGMLAREWKKASSLRLGRISLLWRRTTRKSASRLPRVRMRRATVTSTEHHAFFARLFLGVKEETTNPEHFFFSVWHVPRILLKQRHR